MRGGERRPRVLRVRPEDAGPRPVRDLEGGDGTPPPRSRRARLLRGRGLSLLPVEPPGEDLPGGAGAPAPELSTLRLTAAVVAIAVAVVGHGPAVVPAALVALMLGYPLAVATAGLAFVATTIRWGSGWLVAVTGAQAVLGRAIAVGPAAAAASSWLAAGSLAMAVPDRSLVVAAGTGTVAALLVAGTGGWGGVVVRVLATAIAVGATVVAGRLGHARLRAIAAAALALAAVVLAAAG